MRFDPHLSSQHHLSSLQIQVRRSNLSNTPSFLRRINPLLHARTQNKHGDEKKRRTENKSARGTGAAKLIIRDRKSGRGIISFSACRFPGRRHRLASDSISFLHQPAGQTDARFHSENTHAHTHQQPASDKEPLLCVCQTA